jgi:hypothetical protein
MVLGQADELPVQGVVFVDILFDDGSFLFLLDLRDLLAVKATLRTSAFRGNL